MTPTDIMFLYFCTTAVSWAGHWVRKWERRDRDRQIDVACGELLREIMSGEPIIVPMNYSNRETDPTD